jgi:hypothetical protein
LNWIERWRGLAWDPPGHAGWLFIVLAVAAVAYAVFVYRRTDAPLKPALRALLAGLRAMTLLILIAILCRPVVSLAVPGGAARGVLLLLDRSESLTLSGARPEETRDEELRRAAAAVRRELEGEYPLSARPFATALGDPLEPDLIPPPDGEATDIAAALEQGMAGGGPAGRPGAMVLVSDGTVTQGTDPVSTARRLGIPVQTVSLGSSRPAPDLAVTRVRANREAFAGERTPVEAVLRLQGLDGTSVQVRLLDVTDGERELSTSTVRLEPGGAEVRADLSFVPPRPGLRFIEVRVPTLPGEATGANNRRLVAIDVREEKTGVVILSGRLTWDHTFLRRALEADSTLALSAGYWSKGSLRTVPGTKPPPSLNGASLHGVRVIVLDHVSPAQLGADGAQGVLAFVRAGGGLLIVTGSEDDALSAWRGNPLEALLPVQIAGGGGQDTQARLTLAGRRHALFDPSVPGAPTLDAWSDLPPVGVPAGLGPAKGGAETLFTGSAGAEGLPVLSWMRAGQGRVLAFTAGGVWKWDFKSTGLGPGGNVLPSWWRRAAHWLARPDIEARVDIHPEENVIGRGKSVVFVARVTDESYQPVAGAEAEVSVSRTDSSGAQPTRFALEGSEGILSGAIQGLAPGRYRYEGRASSGGNALGAVDGVFAVDSLGAEMERLEADHELLARIAQASGGKLWSPDSLDGLSEEFRAIAQAEEERVQVALWDSPFAFALFVAFASAEWFLRRRRGMI